MIYNANIDGFVIRMRISRISHFAQFDQFCSIWSIWSIWAELVFHPGWIWHWIIVEYWFRYTEQLICSLDCHLTWPTHHHTPHVVNKKMQNFQMLLIGWKLVLISIKMLDFHLGINWNAIKREWKHGFWSGVCTEQHATLTQPPQRFDYEKT
jgi:hypothetical protein